ncbi:MAG TPA: YciI family protein [Gaiellaceae bacterium]|nr:YciI family protein [Gaiellaceae bacterium]
MSKPELVPYTVRLYRSGPAADAFTEEELERLQSGHLDFLAGEREAGMILASGPFADQPDESLRGFGVMNASIDEIRARVERDPAVAAGRLRADVFTWLVPDGMRFGA